MRSGLIGIKKGMSFWFDATGKRIPLTLVHVDDCQVFAQKTKEKDGYNAVVLGVCIQKKPSSLSKPMRQAFANAKIEPRKKLKEFRVSEDNMLSVGSVVTPEHFSLGQYVDVTGTSLGKGFAGAMKRWNFRGLEATHGVSVSHRSHGSTGQRQDPGKVFKNKKMAGHLGCEKVTVQNLKVVGIDLEKNIVIISGAVPGSKGSFVYIKDSVKKLVKIN